MRGLLIVVPCLVAEHGLEGSWVSAAVPCGLNSGGSRAELHRSTWGLPGSGVEPMSPALGGGVFTLKPSRKPKAEVLHHKVRNLGLYHF